MLKHPNPFFEEMVERQRIAMAYSKAGNLDMAVIATKKLNRIIGYFNAYEQMVKVCHEAVQAVERKLESQ